MRRLAVLLSSFVVALGVFAAPALATFHLNMVNEVMLASSAGDSGVGFRRRRRGTGRERGIFYEHCN